MKRTIGEAKALKLLKADSFRNVKKGQIVELVGMIDKMDPQVAMKAIEQFPDLTKAVSELLKVQKETLNEAMLSNQESMKAYYKHCEAIMRVAEKMCESDNFTTEERFKFVHLMKEITELTHKKDSENKRFNFAMTSVITCGTVMLGGFLVNSLGSNVKIRNPFKKSD